MAILTFLQKLSQVDFKAAAAPVSRVRTRHGLESAHNTLEWEAFSIHIAVDLSEGGVVSSQLHNHRLVQLSLRLQC